MSAINGGFDLHLHTYWSYDACAAVEGYFRLASEKKARAIAITEHFTMDSLPDVLTAAKQYPDVRFIAGAEMTVTTSRGAIDMVCLGLPLAVPAELETIFERYRQWQRDIGELQSKSMCALGYEFSRETRLKLLRRYRPEKAIQKQGATHVSGYLLRQIFKEWGFIAKEEDFGSFMEKVYKDAPVSPYPSAKDVLPVIKKHGGVVFIAHPLHYFKRDCLTTMDALREELGFDGIECAHSTIPTELTAFYRDYCVKHKLLSTAGSDCHSTPDQARMRFAEECEFLRHCGDRSWFDEILERVTPQ